MNDLANSAPKPGTEPYRLTAEDYTRLILAGGFGEAHVELVEGELVKMSPSQSIHGKLLGSVFAELRAVCAPLGFDLFIDTMVQLSDATIRAPDISVVDGKVDDRRNLAPADLLLAVEIADSTLTEDLGRKRIDYASAGIRNYWVVDVEGRRTHCYTDPQGADYAAIRVAAFGEAIVVPGAKEVIVIG